MSPRQFPKDRWSVRFLPLTGITAGRWWDLLRRVRFDVDAAYAHRAAFVSLCSLLNSANAFVERWRFTEAVRQTAIEEAPVFVLGHWRSGTTHLHNLLAQDSERFAFPNTYQVVNPETFLLTEAAATRLFRWMVPKKRPMDNMELAFELPQEDEFVTFLTTLASPYMGIHFPRWMREYECYLGFDGVPVHEVQAWSAALRWFLQKMTLRSGRRALVLKSPTHTARIRLLLEMFPRARFVHIHRHPYEVFQSTCHYFDTAPWLCYLQVPEESPEEGILRRYSLLYDAFFSQVQLIPAGQYHEVRFADLERDPMGELRALYAGLGWEGFASVAPRFEAYLQRLRGYRRNRFSELNPAQRERVRRDWQRSFQLWGYQE